MITCLGSLADPTFRHTVAAMRKHGLDGELIDLGYLVMRGNVTLPLNGQPGRITLAGRTISVEQPVVARLIDISRVAPTPELRRRAEGVQVSLARYLSCLPWTQVVGGTWDNSNFSKAYQLSCASGRSWAVPRTCVTNDPSVAKAFVQSVPTIYKGPSSSKTWANVMSANDIDRLPQLRHSPVLFQERITGLDVRVHVVADKVFAEAITATLCDYRTDPDARFEPVTVPSSIAADCIDLTRKMKLVLSGIDFKVSESGQWFFLEANSAPCYQGYDKRAFGAISDALSEYLRRADAYRPT